jgi:purine-nucleoside phosphorylase
MEAWEYIKEKADIMVVLGSGLGFLADGENIKAYDYSEIPNFTVSTVKGHKGRLVFKEFAGKTVMFMQGRIHSYEGVDSKSITYPFLAAKKLGIENLIITNSAGGINLSYKPGDLMVIKDHIMFTFKNPLRGPNDDKLGERFPDMYSVYDKEWSEKLIKESSKNSIELKSGVYLQASGPSYETKAEIRFFRKFEADAVGMSTVPEAIYAKYLGMKILGISCITNMAAGVLKQPLNHKEVMETANRVKDKFGKVVKLAIGLS